MTRPIRNLTIVVVSFLVAASPALAATFIVSNADDTGPGSLREAIGQAEANATADEITFDADYTIVLGSSLPDITTDIIISGNGWEHTVIDGGNTPGGTDGVRAFLITTGFLTLDAVTVSNCYGSAVINTSSGQLLVTNSQLSQNKAIYGGAIGSSGPATIETTSFISNESSGGGAIYTDGSTLQATGCTFFNNSSTGGSVHTGWGGAVGVRWAATAGLTNCTFSDNSAEQRGGAIYVDHNATATFSFVTISRNVATVIDSGIYVQDSATNVDITHSIVTDKCRDDGSGASITSLGFNLDAGDTCGFDVGMNDLINDNPQLGTLQDNGGPTVTMALPASSPAVDAGDVTCGAVTTDQRGLGRPSDGDGDGTPECDIGAFELQQASIFSDGFESGGTTNWSVVMNETNRFPQPLNPLQ